MIRIIELYDEMEEEARRNFPGAFKGETQGHDALKRAKKILDRVVARWVKEHCKEVTIGTGGWSFRMENPENDRLCMTIVFAEFRAFVDWDTKNKELLFAPQLGSFMFPAGRESFEL